MSDSPWGDLAPDTCAIVAASMAQSVVLLRANRWDETKAKLYVARLYREIREELRTNVIFHEGPPI